MLLLASLYENHILLLNLNYFAPKEEGDQNIGLGLSGQARFKTLFSLNIFFSQKMTTIKISVLFLNVTENQKHLPEAGLSPSYMYILHYVLIQ